MEGRKERREEGKGRILREIDWRKKKEREEETSVGISRGKQGLEVEESVALLGLNWLSGDKMDPFNL